MLGCVRHVRHRVRHVVGAERSGPRVDRGRALRVAAEADLAEFRLGQSGVQSTLDTRIFVPSRSMFMASVIARTAYLVAL